MTSVIISLEIIDYLPNSFNFSNFGFIFKCENSENEITFFDRNQIVHKFQLKKRDLKYNIKVTKNDSLIGISEFIIPFNNFLSKKLTNFEKICSITMTDSSKRLLGIKNNIQIDVHCVLQYVLNQNNLKQSHSLPKNEMKKKLNMSPKESSENINKNSNDKNKTSNQKNNNMKHKSSNQIKNLNKNIKEKNILEKKIFSNTPNPKKNKNENNLNNESFINSLIEFPSNQLEIEKKLNSLSVDNSQNINNMNIEKLKQNIFNLIQKIIELEKLFKNILKEKIKLRNNYKDYLNIYYKNYKNIKKKEKKLNKISNLNDFNNYKIFVNREENNNINKIIKTFNIQFDLYKFLLKYDNSNNNNNNNNNNDETLNIILKSFNNVINRYGSIEKVLANNMNNNLMINNEILSKYNLLSSITFNNNLINEKIEEENENEISQENNEINNNIKFENVIVSKPDNNDIKLEKFLKSFYSKRNFNKIPFKKTSKNNYEYDNQKIMLKFEGENIRVRYKGGYILLDKFIESNSDFIDDNKLKNKKRSNISSANKKKNYSNNNSNYKK